ncbi:unnamed protein product [Orchesella dallaii]|uniref:Uncharacterized protein n=1 Tax=Orchesella dallaii TaxID=48710 RepID=A0ABP1RK42_9HEXA
MENHPGNPFPTRKIHVELPDESKNVDTEFIDDFWTVVVLLLEMFGNHVHYATISMDGSETLGFGNLINIRSCLRHLPNLRGLKLLSFELPGNNAVFNDFYRRDPLPQLRHLESVELDMVDGAVMHHILNSCCIARNVTRLCLSICYYDDLVMPNVVSTFSNLEVLDAFIPINELERLGNLDEKPPLKKLSLELEPGRLNRPVNYRRIIAALEPFANSLVHFELDTSFLVGDSAERLLINLPNLQKLVFSKYEGSLDPLIQFKSLTYLEITEYTVVPKHVENYVIDLHKNEEKVFQSNIWILIPSLETLCFKKYLYQL